MNPFLKLFVQVLASVVIGLTMWLSWARWREEPIPSYVVFVGDPGGNPDLYRLDSDGQNLLRLTDDPQIDTDPLWSPDGRGLVFTSFREGSPQLYWIGADGQGLQMLLDYPAFPNRVLWSPRGDKLAYLAVETNGVNIYQLSMATGERQRFTRSPNSKSLLGWGRWGLIYWRNALGIGEIIHVDPQNPTQARMIWEVVTYQPPQKASPDQHWLLAQEDSDIWLTRWRDGYSRQLNRDGLVLSPSWSPNSRWIAYWSILPDSQLGLRVISVGDWQMLSVMSMPPIDTVVKEVGWLPDSSGFIFPALAENHLWLYHYDLKAGETRLFSDAHQWAYQPSVSPRVNLAWQPLWLVGLSIGFWFGTWAIISKRWSRSLS